MYSMQPDTEWIAAFKRGETHALNHVFKLYNRPLRYFAEQLTGDRQEAEDIVAETFIKLWKRHPHFETALNIRAFLYITARNACLDFLNYTKKQHERKKELTYLSSDDEQPIIHTMIKAEILGEIYREIEQLPTECKKVFKMSYLEGLRNQEIADQLNLSVHTVKNQKARAIKLMRVRLNISQLILFLLSVVSCQW
jgi:RNA polymerase sigma-70 factor (family 1)